MRGYHAVVAGLFIAVSVVMLGPFDEAIVFGLVTAYGLRVLADRIEEEYDLFSETLFLGGVLSLIVVSLYWLVSSTASVAFGLLRLTTNVSEGIEQLLQVLDMADLTVYVAEIELFLRSAVQDMLFSVAVDVPWMVLQTFAFGLVVYYGFKEGPGVWTWIDSTINNLPEGERDFIQSVRDRVIMLVREVFVVYGLSAIVLAVIAAVGFYVIGVLFLGYPLPFWWFWAVLVGLAAFLPLLASGFFIGPMVVYYAGIGELGFAITLGVFSLVFLWMFPETVLRPWLGSAQMNENYLVLVIGFTAGVLVFGAHGMVTGPVIVITAKKVLMDELGRMRGG